MAKEKYIKPKVKLSRDPHGRPTIKLILSPKVSAQIIQYLKKT